MTLGLLHRNQAWSAKATKLDEAHPVVECSNKGNCNRFEAFDITAEIEQGGGGGGGGVFGGV